MNSVEAPVARMGDLNPVMGEVMVLLSTITHTDASCESLSNYNFMRAIAHTDLRRSVLLPEDKIEIAHVEAAMQTLAHLSARQRRILVMACTASVFANQSTNLEEAWVLRAICEGFNFPMPAVLPGHEIEAGV